MVEFGDLRSACHTSNVIARHEAVISAMSALPEGTDVDAVQAYVRGAIGYVPAFVWARQIFGAPHDMSYGDAAVCAWRGIDEEEAVSSAYVTQVTALARIAGIEVPLHTWDGAAWYATLAPYAELGREMAEEACVKALRADPYCLYRYECELGVVRSAPMPPTLEDGGRATTQVYGLARYVEEFVRTALYEELSIALAHSSEHALYLIGEYGAQRLSAAPSDEAFHAWLAIQVMKSVA